MLLGLSLCAKMHIYITTTQVCWGQFYNWFIPLRIYSSKRWSARSTSFHFGNISGAKWPLLWCFCTAPPRNHLAVKPCGPAHLSALTCDFLVKKVFVKDDYWCKNGRSRKAYLLCSAELFFYPHNQNQNRLYRPSVWKHKSNLTLVWHCSQCTWTKTDMQ